MQKTPNQKEGSRPKKAPAWRDLTDEQQWDAIYKGRAQKKAAAPKTIRQAVALALPSYCLHMAVTDCHKTFQATIRGDVHTAIVSGIAKVSSLVPEAWREELATQLHRNYEAIKGRGFYLDNKEFLYACAHSIVTLADDWRYPADAPACMAAILLKEDAEQYDEGDWRLSKSHALKMAGICYNSFSETELYAFAEDVIKLVD